MLPENQINSIVELVENSIKNNIPFIVLPADRYDYESVCDAKDKLNNIYRNKTFAISPAQWADVVSLYAQHCLKVRFLPDINLLATHKYCSFYKIEWRDIQLTVKPQEQL